MVEPNEELIPLYLTSLEGCLDQFIDVLKESRPSHLNEYSNKWRNHVYGVASIICELFTHSLAINKKTGVYDISKIKNLLPMIK